MSHEKKRIRFTRAELEVLNDMCKIASALQWSEERRSVLDSVRRKVWELIARKDELPNYLDPADQKEGKV